MMAITTTPDERLTPARRAKLAYIYVRQSSVTQVKHHQESTELQYRLVDRAVALGWPRERVQVIDEDLGKSGAGHADRQGFQKLIAEIGLGNAGLGGASLLEFIQVSDFSHVWRCSDAKM